MIMLITIGTLDYLNEVDMTDVQFLMQYTTRPDPPGSLEFLVLAKHIMDENNLQTPTDVSSALDFYIELSTFIEMEI